MEVAGGGWDQLHPLTSPAHLAAVLAHFCAVAGDDFDAALVKISEMPMIAARALVSEGEDSDEPD